MEVLLIIIVYAVITAAAIFGLLVGARKYTGSDLEFPIGWVLCGIFWPVALLPAIGYIAAGWYINRSTDDK